jgi:predicted Co/Zn/Cd cation transporter (cation efflux family)
VKNSGLIIKIAVGVSAVAVVFSLVTLIRSIVIGGTVVFPIIQLVGSAAIFAICFLMLRTLKELVLHLFQMLTENFILRLQDY